MAEQEQNIFRKKTIDRISSPEQLTDYLCVTNPGIWVILAAVILLLAGLFAWASIGTLETTASVSVIVEDHTARVVPTGTVVVKEGMELHVAGEESSLDSIGTDEYGRCYGVAAIPLSDGIYSGTLIMERTHPIGFLVTSR